MQDIEAFLISSTVVSVLAQGLLRRAALPADHADADEVRRLGYQPKDVTCMTSRAAPAARSPLPGLPRAHRRSNC
ncbi:MAG: hypothetical protein IPG61_17600 [bacterium]|nr:hypothetical protein [bacterium]